MPGTRDYVIRMPKDTEVVAACEQVRCDSWQHGWDTVLDERTAEGRDAARWIRSGQSGRDYAELGGRTGDGLTVFRFSPGQRCFAEHRTKPASFLVIDGRQRASYPGMAEWLGDLDEHVGRLAAG